MDENALNQYEWFEELKEKESEYRKIQDKYDSIVNRRRMLENDLKISKNDSLFNAQKIEIYSADSLRLVSYRDQALLEDLKSKLSTIPQSIVLVGRLKQVDETNIKPEERIKCLMQAMTITAIKEKRPASIISYRYSSSSTDRSNDDLKQLYEISNEGIAQTADKYYKTFTATLPKAPYLYEIYRIEVFPFNLNSPEKDNLSSVTSTKETQSVFQQSNNIDSDINIYRVDMKGDEVEGLIELLYDGVEYNEGNTSSLEDHTFKDEEKNFINSIYKNSNSVNEKYDKKIEEAISTYKKEKSKLTQKLQKIAEENKNLRNEAMTIAYTIDTLRKSHNDMDKQREQMKQSEYKKAKEDYESFYQKKYQPINQLAVKNGSELESGYKTGFEDLVADCYQAVNNNIQKRYNKTTIFKEEESGQLLTLTSELIEYTPAIDSFQVLSMILYEKEVYYLALNMAFKVRWQLSDKSFIKPDLVVSDDLSTAKEYIPPVSSTINNPNSNSINVGETKSDYGKSWKLYDADASSINVFLADDSVISKWRLPEISELKAILNNPEARMVLKEKINPDNVSSKLRTNPIFPSSHRKWSEDNIRVYESLSLSFEPFQYIPDEVEEGKMVYIIMVK